MNSPPPPHALNYTIRDISHFVISLQSYGMGNLLLLSLLTNGVVDTVGKFVDTSGQLYAGVVDTIGAS